MVLCVPARLRKSKVHLFPPWVHKPKSSRRLQARSANTGAFHSAALQQAITPRLAINKIVQHEVLILTAIIKTREIKSSLRFPALNATGWKARLAAVTSGVTPVSQLRHALTFNSTTSSFPLGNLLSFCS